MASALPRPEWATLGGVLEIPRIINGLWQVTDNPPSEAETVAAAEAMNPLSDFYHFNFLRHKLAAILLTRLCRITAGLDTFDMADHYGPAELIAGAYARTFPSHPIKVFTKWCPADPKANGIAAATAAVDLALSRTALSQLPLLQYHIWDYTNPSYLANLCHLRALQQQGKITLLGLTNADAAHLELLLHSGFQIASNQVSVSVLDRRLMRGRMAGVCRVHGVGILAYGALLGGFLSEKWVGAAEPRDAGRLSASLRKYLRFIRAAGGWGPFQGLLRALAAVAAKHSVGIAAVAIRWVLDVEVVKAVIVGCRLDSDGSSARQAAANMAAFRLRLDAEDRAVIARAQEGLRDIHGDCGDEYRRPPYLTAAGDLSDHIRPDSESALRLERAVAAGKRIEFRSGSKWEPIAVYITHGLGWAGTPHTNGAVTRDTAVHSGYTMSSACRAQRPTRPWGSKTACLSWAASAPDAKPLPSWTPLRLP